jgi:DNA repair and recombination RAD54-like protein
VLASIKACSERINLVGAFKVVLLNVVWNPSVERQDIYIYISRSDIYVGQEKVVYICHLIATGTNEGEKYYRQVLEKDFVV